MILIDAFNELLRDRVNLNKTRLQRIKSAHWSVRQRLEEDAKIAEGFVDTKLQGSYALGTATRCPHGERPYDVDVVLGLDLEDEWGNLPSGSSVLYDVRDTLEAVDLYAGKTEVRERCVRVAYSSDGLDFHLDVVPVHVPEGLRDPLLIPCDWRETNPLGYIDWFDDVNRERSGHLRRVVRLLKYWRDLHRLGSPNSMVLTTLAGQFLPSSALSDDDALVQVISDMAAWAADQPAWSVPSVENPSLPDENLARGWSYSDFIAFRDCLLRAADDARAARGTEDEEEAIELWNGPHLYDGEFPTTVRGLGKDERAISAAFLAGGLAVGPSGRIGATSGVVPPSNRGFFGRR